MLMNADGERRLNRLRDTARAGGAFINLGQRSEVGRNLLCSGFELRGCRLGHSLCKRRDFDEDRGVMETIVTTIQRWGSLVGTRLRKVAAAFVVVGLSAAAAKAEAEDPPWPTGK